MKPLLKIIFLLQLFATGLWLWRCIDLQTTYADLRENAGYERGHAAAVEEIRATGISLPERFSSLGDKDVIVSADLASIWSEFLAFWPALILESAVLVLLLGELVRPEPKSRPNT